METQFKVYIASDALCELNKCGVGLKINEKESENIKSRQKIKVCFIGKRSTFGRIYEHEKECIDTKKV